MVFVAATGDCSYLVVDYDINVPLSYIYYGFLFLHVYTVACGFRMFGGFACLQVDLWVVYKLVQGVLVGAGFDTVVVRCIVVAPVAGSHCTWIFLGLHWQSCCVVVLLRH